jgi:putative endonuclease
MTSIHDRRRAFRLGLGAECRAAWCLRLKGHRILARRFRSHGGEADLIARRGATLVFVEVKARSSFAEALEAIQTRQQRRIAAAARVWLARHPSDRASTLRFDAVVVAPGRWPRHVERAFEVEI